ncbi:MAG: hypothetical protein JSV05_03095 [Candidatus Bathyarchaeota archaeon]|nr:MAG: hypothetical protein JSV05_03095 [Candidatus Bathyarchaeota archaeon]
MAEAIKRDIVDNYITNHRVHTIDINKTVQQARKMMDNNDVDFLIVTRNGEPELLIKKYQTVLPKKDVTLADIAGNLKSATVVDSGTPWFAVSSKLAESTVLVVADRSAKSMIPNLIGTISVYDMHFKQR